MGVVGILSDLSSSPIERDQPSINKARLGCKSSKAMVPYKMSSQISPKGIIDQDWIKGAGITMYTERAKNLVLTN